MKKDFAEATEDVSKFITGNQLTKERTKKLEFALSFEKMKQNAMITPTAGINPNMRDSFMRKGMVGDWKTNFEVKMTEEWNAWIKFHFVDTGMEKSAQNFLL